jgi:hypothetical protein
MEHRETLGGPGKPAPVDDKNLLKGNRTQDLAETNSDDATEIATHENTDPLANPQEGPNRPI